VALPVVTSAPPAGNFAEIQRNAESIEGFMSGFSMQAMDAVLSHQESLGQSGHLLEFGVWKGRSASLISAHARPDERLILADVSQLLTPETLAKFYRQPEFIQTNTEDFRRACDLRPLKRAVRFLHIDSGHEYRTTLAEMKLADDLLAEGGIACLDDFTNLNYSQILAAAFKYLYTTKTDLCFFMVTDDKGYLCRRPWYERYGRFVLEQVVAEMAARGHPGAAISRTSYDAEYRAFYLRGRDPAEASGRYGEELYATFYQAP
jgi:hypothetical protein